MNPGFRSMRMVGSLEQLAYAQQLVHAKLGELVALGSLPPNFLEELPVQIAIQQDKIGRVIGRAGAGFKLFKSQYNVTLKVDRVCIIEQGEETRTVTLTGELANNLLAQAELLKIEAQANSGVKRSSDYAASGESPYQRQATQAPQGYGASYGADPSNPYAADPSNPYAAYGQQQGYGLQQPQAAQYGQQQAWGADPQGQYGAQQSVYGGSMPAVPQMSAAGQGQHQLLAAHELVNCRFTIKNKHAGIIIGKSGASLTQTRTMSGCQSVKVLNPEAGAEDDSKRVVSIDGMLSSVQAATLMIINKLHELKQQTGEPDDEKYPQNSTLELLIPQRAAGVIIGKGGASCIEIRKITGAFVRVAREEVFESERVCGLSGKPDQIVAAQAEVLSRATNFLAKNLPDNADPAVAAMMAAQGAGGLGQ